MGWPPIIGFNFAANRTLTFFYIARLAASVASGDAFGLRLRDDFISDGVEIIK